MSALQWLLLNTKWLNLFSAVAVVVVGLTIYFVWKPDVFRQHRFTEWAFWFLMGQWLGLVLIYIIIARLEEHQGWLVAALDLQSLSVIGFAWIFLQGDELRWKETCGTLLLIGLFLWLWNLSTNPGSGPETANGLARLTWLAPSEAVAAFALPLMGFAFFVRYRVFGFPLLVISVAYAACQRPVYTATLESATRTAAGLQIAAPYLLALAIGKLIVAGLTFGLFFAPVSRYSTATPELEEETRAAIKKNVWKSVKWTVGAVALPVLIAVLTQIFRTRFPR